MGKRKKFELDKFPQNMIANYSNSSETNLQDEALKL